MKTRILAIFLCLLMVPAPSKSMNNDAVKSYLWLIGGAAVYFTVGKKLIKYCGTPGGFPLCALGGLAIATSVSLMRKKEHVQTVVEGTCERNVDCKAQTDYMLQQELPQVLPPDVLAETGSIVGGGDIDGKLQREINNMDNAYKNAGVVVDPATGKISKDGKSVNAKDLNNPSAMAGAGMSSDQISALQSVQNDMNQNIARVVSNANGISLSDDEGGGRGRGVAAYGGGSAQDGYGGLGANSVGGSRGPASEGVAGLSRQTSTDEQIGVAGDNIFGMINRRYAHGLSNGKYDPNLPAPR